MQDNPHNCCNMKDTNGCLNMFWIVLYNQESPVHIFCNVMFLVNVQKMNKCLELRANTGSIIISKVGELPGVGTVWVHYSRITIILSFHNFEEVNELKIDYSSCPNKHSVFVSQISSMTLGQERAMWFSVEVLSLPNSIFCHHSHLHLVCWCITCN